MESHGTIASLSKTLNAARQAGATIGFVPTMGALHRGHLSLVEAATANCDVVVLSIFVNPLQFGPSEDFDRYPRPAARDEQLCQAAGVDHLFVPSVGEMYPNAALLTSVSVKEVSQELEGRLRPGHFDGVATVVAKLLSIVGHSVAFFGEKDWQQLEVVKRMAADLSLPVEIRGCPTVRDDDGLALSSRNQYLSDTERVTALSLSATLRSAQRLYSQGVVDSKKLTSHMVELLSAAGGLELEYAAHVGPAMVSKPVVEPGDRLLVAARVGTTRLIDNLAVEGATGGGEAQ